MNRRTFLGTLAALAVAPAAAGRAGNNNYSRAKGPAVCGAEQLGTTIQSAGWSAGETLTRGDVFSIAGVYALHPSTGVRTAHLLQFVVTADVTADSRGCVGIPVWPALRDDGLYRTVARSPRHQAAFVDLRQGRVVGSSTLPQGAL